MLFLRWQLKKSSVCSVWRTVKYAYPIRGIYRCTVIDVDDRACQESGLDILQDMEGYISGAEMLLAQCVLAFNMAPGQRLNVTVLDFTANSTAATENQLQSADGSARCPSTQVRLSSRNPVGDQLSPGRMRATTPTSAGGVNIAGRRRSETDPLISGRNGSASATRRRLY